MDLQVGSRGACVVALRHRLAAYGLEAPETDSFDPAVRERVREFEELSDLPATGVADAAVRELLAIDPEDDAGAVVDDSDAAVGAHCDPLGCVVVVVSVRTTREIANWLDRNQVSAATAAYLLTTVGCMALRPAVRPAARRSTTSAPRSGTPPRRVSAWRSA